MKKAGKILLIILLIAGLAVGGYFIYEHFFANKIKEIDAAEGWEKYVIAQSGTNAKDEFWVTYTVQDERTSKKEIEYRGDVTIDSYGTYRKLSGDKTYRQYAVKMVGSSGYALFTDDEGTKTSETLTNSAYASKYKNLSNVEFVGFINSGKSESEQNIKTQFFGNGTVVDEKIENLFGEVRDGFAWRTTFTCKFTDFSNTKTYSSKVVRTIYFYGNTINAVEYELEEEEIDSSGNKVRNGESREMEVRVDLSFNTNTVIVETDFSDFDPIN